MGWFQTFNNRVGFILCIASSYFIGNHIVYVFAAHDLQMVYESSEPPSCSVLDFIPLFHEEKTEACEAFLWLTCCSQGKVTCFIHCSWSEWCWVLDWVWRGLVANSWRPYKHYILETVELLFELIFLDIIQQTSRTYFIHLFLCILYVRQNPSRALFIQLALLGLFKMWVSVRLNLTLSYV